MTFLQALYGSQYKELKESGRDAAKGRLNGNIFLSAFIVIILIILASVYVRLVTVSTPDTHGLSGKNMGKLLAIPLFAVIYLVIASTIGTVENYERITADFSRLQEREQAKANKQVLVPFFIALAIMLVLVLV